MRVTMREVAAGEGWNEGPELRVRIQTNEQTTVPRAIASCATQEQRELFSRYQPEASDWQPIFGHLDGYRFTTEWTFPLNKEN